MNFISRSPCKFLLVIFDWPNDIYAVTSYANFIITGYGLLVLLSMNTAADIFSQLLLDSCC